MNVRRGLLRLWVVASAIYIITDIAIYWSARKSGFDCLMRTKVGPWCDYWGSTDFVVALGELLLPPLAVLVLGGALIWAATGFRRDRPSN
jgi:hypothetical protein